MILDYLRKFQDIEEFDECLDMSPYAKKMGFRFIRQDGILTTAMKFHGDLVGAPIPPQLHGGTVASLMEMAALLHLAWDLNMVRIPKAIDITIDYMRVGKPEDTFAQAKVYRRGRRFATLHTKAWQSNSEKPIATAMMHFQLVD